MRVLKLKRLLHGIHGVSPCILLCGCNGSSVQEGGKFFLFDASRSTLRHEIFFDDNVHFQDLKIVRPYHRREQPVLEPVSRYGNGDAFMFVEPAAGGLGPTTMLPLQVTRDASSSLPRPMLGSEVDLGDQ